MQCFQPQSLLCQTRIQLAATTVRSWSYQDNYSFSVKRSSGAKSKVSGILAFWQDSIQTGNTNNFRLIEYLRFSSFGQNLGLMTISQVRYRVRELKMASRVSVDMAPFPDTNCSSRKITLAMFVESAAGVSFSCCPSFVNKVPRLP